MRKILLIFSIAIFALVIMSLFFFKNGVYVQAQKAFYYPETCLGGWKSAKNASGVPDGLEKLIYDDNNSAVFKDGNSEIFCGEFKGDLPPQTYHTRVILRFSWQQKELESVVPKDPNLIDTIFDIFDGEEESSGRGGTVDETNTEEINDVFSTTSEEVIIYVATTTTSTEVIDTEATSTESLLDGEEEVITDQEISSEETANETLIDASVEVIDQEESSAEPEPQPMTEPEAESASEPVSFWPGLFKTAHAEELSTTTEALPAEVLKVKTASTGLIGAAGEVLVDDALEAIFSVEYTLDGEVWNNIGYVTTIDNDVRFELPREVLVSIEDVSEVQIALRPLPRFDNTPEIYLDSMYLEISYAPIRELGVHAISTLIPEEFSFDDFFSATGTIGTSASTTRLSAEQFLASTTFIHGLDARYAITGVPQGEVTELWLLDTNQRQIRRIGFNEAAIGNYPLGAKDGMIFWLNYDGSILFTYDLRTGGSLHEMALVGNLPPGNESRFTFPFTDWQVVWRAEEFYFFKDSPGEVFKDEDAKAVERLNNYLQGVIEADILSEPIEAGLSSTTSELGVVETTIETEIENGNI